MNKNLTVADMLVRGLDLELPENLIKRVEEGIDATCAITGKRIATGIGWRYVIPSSTGEYLDLLHGCGSLYVSISAAAAYKGSWNLGGRLIFDDGTQYRPFISTKSATAERPTWSRLVRDVWPGRQGQRCVCIIADDYKKRVWPRARVSTLGENACVYLLYGSRGISKNVLVSWPRLIDTLDTVEEIYTAGYNKFNISDGLYGNFALLNESPQRTVDYENSLAQIRHLPEFSIALLIAQKEIDEK